MSEVEARAKLWQQGVIGPWYLKPYQQHPYVLLKAERFPVLEQARRTGKTTEIAIDKIERGLQSSQNITRWCEPWKYQAREIVIPEIQRLQSSISYVPEKYKYKYYTTDSFFECEVTGSRIYLRGVNEDKGESARGSFAHDIVADEYGSWKDPVYITNEVLIPQLLSTNGRLGKASTPPKDLSHVWYEEKEKALREKRFIQRIITDAEGELYTAEQIRDIIEAMGGINSPAVRRELFCEPVADPEMLVVPEFNDSWVIEDTTPYPEYFDAYVGGDSGADDNTAILFGYFDFLNDTLVIDDEIILKGRTSGEYAKLAKEKEQALWNKPAFKRAYDATKQLLIDLRIEHDYQVWLPVKADKQAAIHDFRVRGQRGKVKIKKRCRNLIYQLKVGLWKDEKHLDFERSEKLGHLDAIAAAIYLNRSVDFTKNPYPANTVNPYTNFPGVYPTAQGTKEVDDIASLLRPFAERR